MKMQMSSVHTKTRQSEAAASMIFERQHGRSKVGLGIRRETRGTSIRAHPPLAQSATPPSARPPRASESRHVGAPVLVAVLRLPPRSVAIPQEGQESVVLVHSPSLLRTKPVSYAPKQVNWHSELARWHRGQKLHCFLARRDSPDTRKFGLVCQNAAIVFIAVGHSLCPRMNGPLCPSVVSCYTRKSLS